jgi:hypothetical protein
VASRATLLKERTSPAAAADDVIVPGKEAAPKALRSGPAAVGSQATALAPDDHPERAVAATPEPSEDDVTRLPRPLPAGSVVCLCTGCGRHFLSTKAFDAHQTLSDAGDVVCHRPGTTNGTRTMVVVERRGARWWAFPTRPAPTIARRGVR